MGQRIRVSSQSIWIEATQRTCRRQAALPLDPIECGVRSAAADGLYARNDGGDGSRRATVATCKASGFSRQRHGYSGVLLKENERERERTGRKGRNEGRHGMTLCSGCSGEHRETQTINWKQLKLATEMDLTRQELLFFSKGKWNRTWKCWIHVCVD